MRRAILAEIDRLDRIAARQRDEAQRLLLPDALFVVVRDHHPASIRRYRRLMRTGHHWNISIRLHRLKIDQRHRVGLLVHHYHGAGKIHPAARRLGRH
jgi:hypothetical protein